MSPTPEGDEHAWATINDCGGPDHLILIGTISAGVMVASSGGLQWLAGAIALATPLLARRVLRHEAPRPAPAVVVRLERHGRAPGRVA